MASTAFCTCGSPSSRTLKPSCMLNTDMNTSCLILRLNQDWIKRKIKQEVFMSVFNMQEGFKVLLEGDPQVQKAVEAIPQARALYQNARRVVAQRIAAS